MIHVNIPYFHITTLSLTDQLLLTQNRSVLVSWFHVQKRALRLATPACLVLPVALDLTAVFLNLNTQKQNDVIRK